MLEIHKTITSCKNCSLCSNQTPLIHNNCSAEVFWVGLSAVKTENRFDMPLSETTNSGKLLYRIESRFNSESFYRTNLVKCLPLDDHSKIRYPVTTEMKNCFSNLTLELNYFKPKLVFLLGKPVAAFVLNKYGIRDFSLDNEYDYTVYQIENTVFVPVHHPSYILVYKRKFVETYIHGIQSIIEQTMQKERIFNFAPQSLVYL